MATITSTVGSTGRNYATLALWKASLPASMVSAGNSYVASLYSDTEFDLTGAAFTFSGITTSASFFPTITAATGEAWCDLNNVATSYAPANGVAIKTTTANAVPLSASPFSVFSRLQISAANYVAVALSSTSAPATTIFNCLCETTVAAGANPVILLGGSNNLIYNNIIIQRGGNGAGVAINGKNQNLNILYNNTIVRVSSQTAGGVGLSTGTGTFKNNAFFGWTTAQSGSATGNNNATNLASITGSTSNQVSLTYANQFNTTTDTGRDFRLKSGNNLAGNGATLSGGPTIDAYGVTRATPPAISAVEFISTVKSNVYCATLSAWTSSTFVAKQLCTNLNNVYRCTTAGSSTTAPSGKGQTINNGGAAVFRWLSTLGASDYSGSGVTAIASWVASIPTTLVQAVVALFWNTGTTITQAASTSFVTLSGHTTSSTNTITMTCATGESFRDTLANQTTALAFNTANGVSFTMPSSGGGINYGSISDNWVIIDGLQFKDPFTTSGATIINLNTNNRLQNCIIEGTSQTGGACMIGTNTVVGPITIANCLVIDHSTSSSASGTILAATTGTLAATVVNCTVILVTATAAVAGIWMHSSSGTTIVKNCIVMNYDAASAVLSPSGETTTVTNSVFSAASLTATNVTTGSGNLFSKTAATQFVSSTTDFRLLSTSSAKDAGATDTTDIPTSDDIARTSRPQGTAWDVGCWELIITATGFPRVIWMD